MREITEQEAIELATTPHKITDAYTCNLVIGFLNGHITDMRQAEFELEVAASQHLVDLLKREDATNKLSEAEWKISEPYKDWKRMQNELAKYRAYRNSLRDKEDELKYKPNNNSPHYGSII